MTEVRSAHRKLMPDSVGSEHHEPTSLRAIANKAKADKRYRSKGVCWTAMPCITDVSTTEEPGAEKLHAGVCAGGAG